ncbi:MAG: TetR/AcrR family transcriptional regulator [Phormidesmis sp.]
MPTGNTKTQILDVAQDLIQRLGVNGMSYKDIAEAVGIRKASVHTHFPKKDDLLAALLDRYNERMCRAVHKIVTSNERPEVKLRQYCQLYEATLSCGEQDKVCLYAMVGAELATLNHPLAARVRSFYRENETHLSTILEEGQQNGDFRFSGSTDDLAELVFSLLEGGMLIARADGGSEKLHRVVEQLITLVKR